MLKRLYCLAVRLHPESFRQRFGDEMLYIFDQQRGVLAKLLVTWDCILSLLRQRTLRTATEMPAAIANPASGFPSFHSLDPFQPSASAIINGAMLTLILFYMTVTAVPYSWIHILHPRTVEIAGEPPQAHRHNTHRFPAISPLDILPTDPDVHKLSLPLQPDVISTHSEATRSKDLNALVAFRRKMLLSDRSDSAVTQSKNSRSDAVGLAPSLLPHREMLLLDQYVGKYVSTNPPMTIWIQMESDPLQGDHLSFSSAPTGHPTLALKPVSPSNFIITGARNSYIEFATDVHGRICCLSFVVNSNALMARRP